MGVGSPSARFARQVAGERNITCSYRGCRTPVPGARPSVDGTSHSSGPRNRRGDRDLRILQSSSRRPVPRRAATRTDDRFHRPGRATRTIPLATMHSWRWPRRPGLARSFRSERRHRRHRRDGLGRDPRLLAGEVGAYASSCERERHVGGHQTSSSAFLTRRQAGARHALSRARYELPWV